MNNWYVITGAPCSGKSTILDLLGKKGYKTIPEAARVYIDEQIQIGKTIEEIRSNEMDFQEKVFDMKINTEKNLLPDEPIFFDRGIGDTIAYLKLYSYKINSTIIKGAKKSSYKTMFLFERLPYKKDYARTEDENSLKKLEELLEQAYNENGTPVVRVPRLGIKKRLQFILKHI